MSVQIPEYIDFIRLSDNRALLAGPATTKELRGDSVDLVERALQSLRDGTTAADLADTLDISTSLATDLIDRLQDTGVLQEEPAPHGYWSWAAATLGVAVHDLRDQTVTVLDQTTGDPPSFEDVPFDLTTCERVADLPSMLDETDLLLTLVVGETPDFHHAIVQQLTDHKVDWIPGRLTGATVTVGPFGTPTTQGCYNCYDQRRRASTEISPATVDALDQRSRQGRAPYSEYIRGFLYHMLVTEAVAAHGDDKTPQSSGAIVECDLTQFTMDRREILPVPGCELCGTS